MATSVANAAAHQINLASLPSMPRVRPPRLLKGDPHPNNSTQPPGRPRKGRLWVQGKWRLPSSNAGKQKREVQVRQVTKALRHRTHGLDIYAYRHVRTNQVVYSLSRTLQNTQVLKQMLFHGKKTIPATVRRDMWTPYFSVHFPEHPAGAYVGLSAFKKLRELAMQRQLSPPKAMITATEDDISIAKSKLGGPLQLYRLEQSEIWQDKEKLRLKLPMDGELLPKKLRAKRLMDQKATSVADVAFVLDWISSGPGPLDKMIAIETDKVARHKERTKRARARFNKFAREQEKEEERIEKRAQLVLRGPHPMDHTNAKLNEVQLERLSMEHQTFAILGRNLLEGGDRRDLISEAEEQWQALNPIDPASIDLDEYTERKKVSQQAEHDALRYWHSPENQSSSNPNTSIWTYVKERREAALEKFEEGLLERKKSAALAQAASEAEAAANAGGPTTASVHDLISRMQQAALEKLEEQETKKQQLRRAIQDAKAGLLAGAGLSRGEGEVAASNKPANAKSTLPQSAWSETWDIRMYWADLNDGTFAKCWPQNVVHGLLEPYAVSKTRGEGEESPVRISKSVHTIGGGLNDGWMPHELLTGPHRPEPKAEREVLEPVPLGSMSLEPEHTASSYIVDEPAAPIEQPPPPGLSLLTRLRNIIFRR